MKLPPITINAEEEQKLSPEKALWLAVIERGIRDYCFYFEWIQQHRMNCDIAQHERFYGNHRNAFVLKTIGEYNRLCWFMFSEDSTPYNLSYIFEMLDGDDDMLENIRLLSKKQFKLHLDKIQEANMFPRVIEHILQTTDFTSIKEDIASIEYRQPSVKVRMRIT
jgi:hypothetical protein